MQQDDIFMSFMGLLHIESFFDSSTSARTEHIKIAMSEIFSETITVEEQNFFIVKNRQYLFCRCQQ